MLLNLSFLIGGESNRAQECPPHTQGSRGNAGPPEGGPASGGCRPGHGDLADHAQEVVAPFSGRGSYGVTGSLESTEPSPTATAATVRAQIMDLRRRRRTGRFIARRLGVSGASVSRILRRARLSRWRELEPRPPVRRYERERPGELLHLDIKKLGRITRIGHVAPTSMSPYSTPLIRTSVRGKPVAFFTRMSDGSGPGPNQRIAVARESVIRSVHSAGTIRKVRPVSAVEVKRKPVTPTA